MITAGYKNKGQRPEPMMFFVSLVATLVVVSYVHVQDTRAIPIQNNDEKSVTFNYTATDFPEEGDLFEGDIILRPDQLALVKEVQRSNEKIQPKAKSQGITTSVKTLISDPTAIWPDKTVYYEFAPREFNSAEQNRVINALNDLMSVSCVRFVPRTSQRTFLRLRNNGKGCAAGVGYHINGPLDLFLGGQACQTQGTIQHEILHSLGFWHEHTRTDRDQHITIVWSNIIPGKEFNFYKRNPNEIMTLNLPYDYNSVMHYRSISFAKRFGATTIIPRNPSAASNMGQRIRFSQLDIAKLNRLYKCPRTYYLGDNVDEKKEVEIHQEKETKFETEIIFKEPLKEKVVQSQVVKIKSNGKVNPTKKTEESNKSVV